MGHSKLLSDVGHKFTCADINIRFISDISNAELLHKMEQRKITLVYDVFMVLRLMMRNANPSDTKYM